MNSRSQWRQVLHMLEHATGGWITTHDIYDDLGVKNPSQRIEEIEQQGYQVEREVIWVRGKRAARYRLAPEAGRLFDVCVDRDTSHWRAA